MMVKRKLNGTMESFQWIKQIRKSDSIVHILLKIWSHASSRTGFCSGREVSWVAGWLTKFRRSLKILKFAVD